MKKKIDKKTDRNKKIERFLSEKQPETPCLVVDLDVVAEAYQALRTYLPLAKVFYAVKANPAGEIVDLLRGLGSSFDVASRGEIELCLGRGVAPERLSFGNTIKKERDIAYAYEQGVRLFAFDSAAELEKLARSAPAARRRWRSSCCGPPGSRASIPTACRSMSARSRPTSTSGTAPSAARRACSRCWHRPTSTCAWSISAAAFPRITAATCPASSSMPRQ